MKKSNNINKLNFNKTAIVELNDSHLNEINGGTSPLPAISAVSGQALSLIGSAIGSAVVSAAASIVAVSVVAVSVYTVVKEN